MHYGHQLPQLLVLRRALEVPLAEVPEGRLGSPLVLPTLEEEEVLTVLAAQEVPGVPEQQTAAQTTVLEYQAAMVQSLLLPTAVLLV